MYTVLDLYSVLSLGACPVWMVHSCSCLLIPYGLLGIGYIYVCKNVIHSLLGVESCNTMLDYPPYHVSVGVGYCNLD